MTDVAISVANLRVAYGDTEILHGIGFTVAWGEVRGYLGPNGAGKSTTIRALVGLQAPTSGEVRIAGFDPVREAMRARAGFGYVPDAGGLFTLLTPQEHLALVADRIAFAGPLTHDDGVTMIGSLLAIDFDSRDAARAWLADEPFTRAGLYTGVEIHAFVNLWPQKAGFPPA